MRSHLVAIALAASLTGCATIVAGGPDTVPISTNPPGAYVYVNGQVVGQTPMVVELDRNRSMADIRIYYPGFVPIQISRYKSLNGWVFGNFFLMIWPVVIDIATGNWQRFDDEPIAIGLTPGQAPPPYGVQPQMPMQPQQPPPMLPPAPAPR
jgi:hypothetical protein